MCPPLYGCLGPVLFLLPATFSCFIRSSPCSFYSLFSLMNKLSTIGLLALGVWGCQRPGTEPDILAPTRAKGQIIRYDITYDAQNEHPRPRWIVQLAYPAKMLGFGEQNFAQVKVFDLLDTTTFRVGTKLAFTYNKVPQSRQTPWLTNYEREAQQPFPAGYTPNPELMLSEMHLLQ